MTPVDHWREVIKVAEEGCCITLPEDDKNRIARAAARIANGQAKHRNGGWISPRDQAVEFIARQIEKRQAQPTLH